MSEKIKGFAALTRGATLTPFAYATLPLKENELRIDISHCGICGIRGGYSISPIRSTWERKDGTFGKVPSFSHIRNKFYNPRSPR